MAAKTLVMISSGIELATGVACIAASKLVAALLLGTSLSESGIAVARLAGIALLCLGVACWPVGAVAGKRATQGLIVYNLLAAVYLGYLRSGGGFVSYLLWPASIIHGALALLLAGAVYGRSGSGETG